MGLGGIIRKLIHLFVSVFLYSFGTYMVIPSITDVTMSAVCPGRDECSIAIYLTGFQQVVTGIGTLLMMPLLGNLSDKYGRKALLTIPMILTIIPLGILGYSRSRNFFYIYYALKTLTDTLCEGTVYCLALAYAADTVPEWQRASAFGLLSAVGSSAFVCGNISARFLSIPSTFQIATFMAALAAVYMRIFLTDYMVDGDHGDLSTPILTKDYVDTVSSGEVPAEKSQLLMTKQSMMVDLFSLLKSSLTFRQAAIVAFFTNLADVGLHASMMYYLKAKFHFNKDKFADLMVINGLAGTISQLLLMPILVPALGEERLLSVGLFFSCTHIILYSFAWSDWVAYVAAMFSIMIVFTQPCLRSIVSKQVSSREQGKAQGCVSGISSFANVISPLVFSPLTALFLSDNAPFDFPGFSIMCAGSVSMIALIQSMMMIIKVSPPTIPKVSSCSSSQSHLYTDQTTV